MLSHSPFATAMVLLFVLLSGAWAVTSGYELAARSSLRSIGAGHEYMVEAADEDAARRLEEAGLRRVTSADCRVRSSDGRASDVLLKASDDPDLAASYGRTVASDNSSSPSGAAVSRAVADALGVDVGDTVTTSCAGQNHTWRLERVFVLLDEPSRPEVVVVGNIGTTAYFSAGDDVSAQLEAAGVTSADDAIVTSVAWRAEGRLAAAAPAAVAVARSATVVLPILAFLAAVAWGLRIRPRTSQRVAALGAAGATRGAARRWLACGLAVIVVASAMGAIAVAAVAIAILSRWSVSIVGQEWYGPPPITIAGAAATAAVVALSATAASAAAVVTIPRLRVREFAQRTTTVIGIALVVASLSSWIVLYGTAGHFAGSFAMAWVSAATAALGAAFVAPVIRRGRSDGVLLRAGAYARTLAGPSVAALVLVTALASFAVASGTRDSTAEERMALRVSSFAGLVARPVADVDLPSIEARAATVTPPGSLGVLGLIDESQTFALVTDASTGRCLAAADGTLDEAFVPCVVDRGATLGEVSISRDDDRVRVSQDVAGAGQATFVQVDTATNRVVRIVASNVATDGTLGGNALPSAAVPRGSELASDLGLSPGGSSILFVPQEALPGAEAAAVLIGAIDTVAPTAIVSMVTAYDDGHRRVIMRILATLTSVLTLVLAISVWAGLRGAIASWSHLLRGVPARRARQTAFTLVWPSVAACGAATIGATLAVLFELTDVRLADLGPWYLLPATTALVGLLGGVLLFPRRVGAAGRGGVRQVPSPPGKGNDMHGAVHSAR